MRKGKDYRYLLPTALAPDMYRYGGLPRYVTPDIIVTVGNQNLFFGSGADDNSVEIDPKTWKVHYFGEAKAGVYTLEWQLTVFRQEDRPGVRIICGGIMNDGSFFQVESQWQWFLSDPLGFGVINVVAPFTAEVYRGVIDDLQKFKLQAVPYKNEP